MRNGQTKKPNVEVLYKLNVVDDSAPFERTYGSRVHRPDL